jgi:hypothetical protein
VPVICWYPLNHGGGTLAEHPDWQMRFYEIDGTSVPGSLDPYVCLNSPYGKLLPQFAAEVVRDVGFDGIWFDGSTFSSHSTGPWSLPGCACDWCRERFKNDTGRDLPEKVDYDDRTFKEWVLWRYDILMGIWRDCVEAVRDARHDAVVCFNNYRRRRPGPNSWNRGIPLQPLGFSAIMSGELDGFPHQADFQMKMHRAYEFSYPPESWWPLCDHWRLWVPDHDPLPAVQAHLGAIAAGGACAMGTGVDVNLMAPVLKAIQSEAQPRARFTDGQRIEYAAIWCSQRYQDFGCRDNPQIAWDQWHGANEICRHSHLQSEIVFDDHITRDDLARFPVLLVGETNCISRKQADALGSYVESGGVLVACRKVGLLDEWGDPYDKPVLDDLLGIKSRRSGEGQPTIEVIDENLAQDCGAHVSYRAPHAVGEPSHDVRILAQVVERLAHSWDGVSDKDQRSTRSPGLWMRQVGNGFVVWTGVELFGEYLHAPTPQMRRMFRHLLITISPPRVELEAPICVTINSRFRHDGMLMIHLHNCPGTAYAYPVPPNANHTHTPGEVVPVHDITIRLNTAIVNQAHSGLSGKAYDIEDNGHIIRVPVLELHDVVLLDCHLE